MKNAIPRSILYTPSLHLEMLHAARRQDADVFLIDLEDSVPHDRKPLARKLCIDFLRENPLEGRTAVRINEMRSVEYIHDMTALVEANVRPAFIFTTMVRSPAEIEIVRSILQSLGWRSEIYVTVETIEALSHLDEIAAVADGLILGSADLGALLGAEITWNNMLYARQKMVHACARYGIGCIDTGCFHIDDLDELQKECWMAKELGFHGKGTVHPKHLPYINAAFRPDAGEIATARKIIAAAASHQDEISVLDGGLVGPPFVKKAKRVLEMSESWAAQFSAANSEE